MMARPLPAGLRRRTAAAWQDGMTVRGRRHTVQTSMEVRFARRKALVKKWTREPRNDAETNRKTPGDVQPPSIFQLDQTCRLGFKTTRETLERRASIRTHGDLTC